MPTTIRLPLLDHVSIASPCPARWEDMTGDERSRRCALCDLDVINIAEMTRQEAEDFLYERLASPAQLRVCARLYRRADGTILTRDCPVGIRAATVRVARGLARTAAALVLLLTGSVALGSGAPGRPRLRDIDPYARLIAILNPVAPTLFPLARPMPRFLGGAVVLPPDVMQRLLTQQQQQAAAPQPAPSGGSR